MSRPVIPEYSSATIYKPSCTTKQRKDSPDGRMERDAVDLDKISSKPVVWSRF